MFTDAHHAPLCCGRRRLTFDLFGKTWTWDSYFQHGETDTSHQDLQTCRCRARRWWAATAPPIPVANGAANGLFSRFNLAQDAVLQRRIGQIVCRNTTVAQAFGCVPFNPFGGTTHDSRPRSPTSTPRTVPGGTTNGPTAIQTQRQEAFSFSVNGSPIDDWAGPVVSGGWLRISRGALQPALRPLFGRRHVFDPCHRQRAMHRSVRRLRLDHPGLAWALGTRATITTAAVTYHVNEVFLEVGVSRC